MRLPSQIRFANEKIIEEFYELENGNNSEKKLFKAINKAMDSLEIYAFSGTQIQKRLIPKHYIEEYNVTNLWKYNPPGGWRLIYSVVNDKVFIISLILEWLEHKDYERRFRY